MNNDEINSEPEDSDANMNLISQSNDFPKVFKNLTIPPLYGVYLLNSITKKSSFYVGSTPNPLRRLRQHNGDLSKGGAYRTKKQGYRPWKLVLYVYGFPSKIFALQFEHAWQHAYQTRHISLEEKLNPGKKHTGSGTSSHSKLANCRLLLNSNSFKRLGLKIAIFNKNIYDIWNKNRYNINEDIINEGDIRINNKCDTELLGESVVIPGGNYDQIKEFMSEVIKEQDEYFEKYDKLIENNNECKLCFKEIKNNEKLENLIICENKDCDASYHLSCLSDKFLNDEQLSENNVTEHHVLPIKGECVECGAINYWNMLIRGTVYH